MNDQILKCQEAAMSMRRNIIQLAYNGGNNGAHIAPSLSIVEILATLYLTAMKLNKENKADENRDRFILSKGHGGLGYYTALHEAGLISKEELYSFEHNGGEFPGQPSKNINKGIDYSGGSLGMGLSYGIGLALSAQKKQATYNVFVLMGDGELNEGIVWEGAMLAAHLNVSNLTVIVDRNGMQSDGMSKDILSIKIDKIWEAYGWHVITCNGHDVLSLLNAFAKKSVDRPRVIIAETIKGKGVSFMENNNEWHHNRLSKDQFALAMKELGGLQN